MLAKKYTVMLLVFLIGFFVIFNLKFNSELPVKVSNICHFNKNKCVQKTQFGSFTLQAEPKIIKSESNIDFVLTLPTDSKLKISKAWLEGKDMYMGRIPLFFQKGKKNYLANTLIGACTENSMVWQMHIELVDEQNTHRLVFEFTSFR